MGVLTPEDPEGAAGENDHEVRADDEEGILGDDASAVVVVIFVAARPLVDWK